MKAIISVQAETNEVTITVQELDWEAVERQSFYEGEGTVQEVLRLAGRELTARLLRCHADAAPQVEVADQIYYRKAASLGHYQTLYGPLALERHLYQTSAGGATICPFEEKCQLQFGAATPLLAEVISFKLASATAREVQHDLAKSHGLTLSASYLQSVAQQVGREALAQRQDEGGSLPEMSAPVATIATGVDGTTMPLVGEGYKEAMCGTLALYEAGGERLTTEYHGALPQVGKTDFARTFATRVQQVLAQFPQALHVCLGDGAKWNWEFFRQHFPTALWILDFYHASAHLHAAAELLFGAGTQAKAYYEEWRSKLLDEIGAVTGLLRSLCRYRKQRGLAARVRQALTREINYFRRHQDHMRYAEFRLAGLPIGSGVTEAGCKELIKARFCRSGMRWKRASGAPILQLRAIKLSQQWDGFWAQVMLGVT
jgi:hypothetical protein